MIDFDCVCVHSEHERSWWKSIAETDCRSCKKYRKWNVPWNCCLFQACSFCFFNQASKQVTVSCLHTHTHTHLTNLHWFLLLLYNHNPNNQTSLDHLNFAVLVKSCFHIFLLSFFKFVFLFVSVNWLFCQKGSSLGQQQQAKPPPSTHTHTHMQTFQHNSQS